MLQSIAQIKMLYKDDYETIIGNCDTAICLGTNEQTTADYFSKKLGKSTITSRSKSTQIGIAGGSMNFTQTGRELMMPDEIMTMPFDECIVMMNHVAPFYDKKYKLEEHPQYEYTGDANSGNLYSLEGDDEFLCSDNTRKCAADVVDHEFSDNDQYEPKTLEEVLGTLLENNPTEDGYFLVKDASSKKEKLFDELIKEKIWTAVEQCIEEEYKVIFYDGEFIDPLIVEPMLNMVMNDETAQVKGAVIAYNPIKGDGRNLKAAAKNDFVTVTDILDKLKIRYELKKGSKYSLYYVNEAIQAPKLGEVIDACKNGISFIASNDDDDIDDYFGMI